MTELKTLKEFEIQWGVGIEWGDGFGIVRTNELKSEAIKWIKALEKNYLTLTEEAKYNGVFERGLIARGKIEFIKHFFNITDSELSMR